MKKIFYLFFVVLAACSSPGDRIKEMIPEQSENLDTKLCVYIDSSGQCFLDNEPMKIEDVEKALQELNSSGSDKVILLQSHKNTTIEDIVRVMSLCKKHEIEIELSSSPIE